MAESFKCAGEQCTSFSIMSGFILRDTFGFYEPTEISTSLVRQCEAQSLCLGDTNPDNLDKKLEVARPRQAAAEAHYMELLSQVEDY